MRKAVLFILLQTIWTTGFCENLRFTQFGTPIPARGDLDVRWNAPVNAFPSRLWVYRLKPATFSSKVISTLMDIGSFTEKDRIDYGTDGMLFKSADDSRTLRISFPFGAIDHDTKHNYSPTNLVEGLPSKEQAVKLTKKLLPKLGIELSGVDKKENSPEPEFHVGDSEIIFYVKGTPVSNTVGRTVGFRRAVDGVAFLSAGTGGDGHITFGDHGKITKIDLSWRSLERSRSYPTVTPEIMMESIRKGRAIQGLLPADSPGIDWPTVKSITIKGAWPRYDAGDRFRPSDQLYPFAALDTAVDTGHGTVNVEIDCPVIDESKR
jgi:hypothetical protein